jgi:hypothetical protein
MALLYGCEGRLTAPNGGFRPGQLVEHLASLVGPAPVSLEQLSAA